MDKGAGVQNDQTGYFLFSLDTEFAWGYFDHFQPAMFSSDGQQERQAIIRLLDILDEYNIVTTWAIVGHLFYTQCIKCSICPVLEWRGKYASFDEIFANSPLWYGADIIEVLLKRGAKHEIAFHGYTHRIFDEERFSKQDALVEIQEWLRAASAKNIIPTTVTFPRNHVGHLDVFSEHGFTCYRGDELLPPNYNIPLIGKVLNLIDLILQIRLPQVYEIIVDRTGLINLPASRSFFRKHQKIDPLLNWLNLDNVHIKKIIKAVEKAANEKKTVHIYAHPHEFRTEKDFQKLRWLLGHVTAQSERGKMRSVGMGELAELAKRSPKICS